MTERILVSLIIIVWALTGPMIRLIKKKRPIAADGWFPIFLLPIILIFFVNFEMPSFGRMSFDEYDDVDFRQKNRVPPIEDCMQLIFAHRNYMMYGYKIKTADSHYLKYIYFDLISKTKEIDFFDSVGANQTILIESKFPGLFGKFEQKYFLEINKDTHRKTEITAKEADDLLRSWGVTY
jgi:hypothetical protein